ncbi:MAG: phospho-N-acetylmuramoyl-pentapeptide-transferase [Deltaproteobacteria bacterium]|nr:phospho-N-acetylmuramoyl-pentapeptide-transferase [Deltaproteobacteria bacterium]
MLYHLLLPLKDSSFAFNVVRYISFRSAAAMATALLICLFLYPRFIRFLQRKKYGQEIRDDGPETHFSKAGTPTMGGLLILAAIITSTLLWARLDEPRVWMVLSVAVGFTAVGFVDDWNKIARKNTKGLSGKLRLLLEFAISGATIGVGVWMFGVDTAVPVPFFKDVSVELGWGYVAFAAFVITGCANAVNLTDGLDGLAIGPVMTSALTFGVLAYLAGNVNFAEYLAIPYVAGAGELTVMTVTIAGAGMGFLWYNSYPAEIFMGDTGSLPLGGILGTLAVLTHNEILLAIVGAVFVAETLSVIIQVISFKTTGKRVFLMAPIHHHFEKKGWEEPKVIVRFWIISILCALVALMSLKLR